MHISESQTERRCYKSGTYKGDQRNSNFTNLLDDALCRAIVPCCDDPVVSPPDIEDATHGLQKVEREEEKLSREFNELSKWQQKNYQADHVDVSRPLEQLPIIARKRHPIPPYVPLCNKVVKQESLKSRSNIRRSR